MDSQAIDRELNEKILSQINWRHGILPSGDIATDPCFVLQEMPIIKLYVLDQATVQPVLVTQSDWTFNLVHSGAVYNLTDDSTLRALSDCQLIFHRLEKPHRKTLHMLNFETVAWFRVDDILQPTKKVQDALDDALQYWPNEPAKAWQGLCKVWTVYGFLWPQKIMLVTTAEEGAHIQHLRQAHASDEATAQMQAEISSSNYHSAAPTTEMHRSPSAVTQQQSDQMALTRVGVPNSPLSHKFQERLRGLELVDVSDDDETLQHQWTIELQGLGLEHDDIISTDMGRNVDIEIGRRKPILHGDIIALRQDHMHPVLAKEVDMIRPGTVEQLWTVEIAMPEDLQYHHTSAAPIAAATSTITTAATTVSTDLDLQIDDSSNSNNNHNVIRRKKSQHGLKVSGDITNLRKKKSMHDFRPSREQDDRDAVVQIQAMISAESLPRGNTPLSARKVRSLTDLVYDLERQPTMEDIETSGSLSFQPPGTDTVDSSPAHHYNADDLDVCASARAEHFIRLYASRQYRKRWSHLIKAGTFSRFGSEK
ncbi:hypothetical protein BDB00DRAFT_787463 [Zychaea mexicana]|uniref:uncharacterized protein n=1 Tax=Zychaea mexicana TaxID=64656 RepID=UPI0022FEEA78|nr:uncharacterized protein BDB00DRAFT_787463 [Zychaea mexicana]KAI9494023.1 hypothetical protein BDB00DRAFT_787463 [Zychaea mexicana]